MENTERVWLLIILMFSQSWGSVPIKRTPNHNFKFIRNPTCEHTVWDELLCLGTIWGGRVLGGGVEEGLWEEVAFNWGLRGG